MQGSFTEKRFFERTLASEELSISYGNMFYSGTAVNLSEKGMFINIKKCFPVDYRSVIFINKKKSYIKLFTKVKRVTESDGYYNGIGVELLSSSQNYLEFVDSLKTPP